MSLNDRENKPKKSIVNAIQEEVNLAKKDDAKKKLKQQAYYITEDHIKAIEMRLFKNKMSGQGETDKSALVRAALEQYFNVELKELEKQ